MKPIIRRATPRDWKTIQKLNTEVFKDNAQYDKYQDMTWSISSQGAVFYQRQLSDPHVVCMLAEMNAVPIGYLMAGKKIVEYRSHKTIEILHMGVIPEYRSKGIGKLLIAELKKWAKQKGYTSMFVNAYMKNKMAIRFYEKSGFTPIDISLEMHL